MARRNKIVLMGTTAIGGDNVQTGNGNQFEWPGGDGVLLVEAKSGAGALALQILGPGSVWVPVSNYATTTAISITAAPGFANFRAPNAPIRLTAGAETGVVASVIGIPANTAG